MICKASHQKSLPNAGPDENRWGKQTFCGKIFPGSSNEVTHADDNVTCPDCLRIVIMKLEIRMHKLQGRMCGETSNELNLKVICTECKKEHQFIGVVVCPDCYRSGRVVKLVPKPKDK